MAEEQNKEQGKEEKKIIIDEDWKQQAQREREVEKAKEKEEKQKKTSRHGPLPKGDFAALVSMLTTQALFALGYLKVEGDKDEKREPDLQLAKYNIDMLETLEQKCKGNLTQQEQKILENTLDQVRMVYVEVSK